MGAGIEWDDATRGKHDGSVKRGEETIRLFTARPGAASFLKLKLVRTGVTMAAALVEKYEGAKIGVMGSVNTTTGGEMEVEFVGEDHIRYATCGSCSLNCM